MGRRLLKKADNFLLTGSAVFRRDSVMEKGGFDERAGSFADGLLIRKIALTSGFFFEPRIFAVWNVFSEGLSRTTALDIERARKALDLLPLLIEQDADFPEWYSAVFRRRWRFGAARLAIEARPARIPLLVEFGAISPWDKWFLSIMASGIAYCPVRWLIVAFLATRLRPYRLRDVVATAAVRRMMLLNAKRRPASGAQRDFP